MMSTCWLLIEASWISNWLQHNIWLFCLLVCTSVLSFIGFKSKLLPHFHSLRSTSAHRFSQRTNTTWATCLSLSVCDLPSLRLCVSKKQTKKSEQLQRESYVRVVEWFPVGKVHICTYLMCENGNSLDWGHIGLCSSWSATHSNTKRLSREWTKHNRRCVFEWESFP